MNVKGLGEVVVERARAKERGYVCVISTYSLDDTIQSATRIHLLIGNLEEV